MSNARVTKGFSLSELLLVCAILGIIGGIAIPSFLGQRERARLIGDAKANAQVLNMLLEARRSEFGVFGSNNVSYSWTQASPTNSLLPTFAPKGNSKMDYTITIQSSGMAYLLEVKDPNKSNKVIWKTNQNGSSLM